MKVTLKRFKHRILEVQISCKYLITISKISLSVEEQLLRIATRS